MYNEKEVKYRKWKFSDLKEVKKVNKPYFEIKVVKVREEKRESQKEKIKEAMQAINSRRPGRNKLVYDKIRSTIVAVSSKGNWVNGENLDKIKFPCFCRWEGNKLGMITSGTPTYGNYEYILHGIEEQDECSASTRNSSLSNLIKDRNIHILKGKIIIFDEEESK